MTKILMFATLLFGASAFAQDQVSADALAKLMNTNPRATDSSGSRQRVNGLVASIVTSSFDSNGVGTLSVTTNECSPSNSDVYSCRLNILNSDRVIKDDAYVPADGMTESSLTIEYKYDSGTKKIVGPVTYMLAG